MPYQFDTGNAGVISLLDSSGDEDDILTPTSRRHGPPLGADSTSASTDLTEEESPDESASDDSDDYNGKHHITRPRLRSRIVLHLQQEIEELDAQPAEPESTSESDSETEIPETVPAAKVRRREDFKKLLGSMEDADDIASLYPKSLHPYFSYPESISDEREVLREFIPNEIAADEDHDTFEELELYDFSIYRGISHDKGFNGSSRVFMSSPQSKIPIWVQTAKSERRHGCWYRLSLPTGEYSSTWLDFVWLADLNKHVLDYLYDAKSKAEKIHLQHFEAAFWNRLLEWHGGDDDFQTWSERCGRITDFRMHVTTHATYLRDQAWSIGGQNYHDSHLLKHALWAEIGAGQFTEDQQSSSHHEQTVVTPNIASAFTCAFPKWGPNKFNLFAPVPAAPEVALFRNTRRLRLGLPDKFPTELSEEALPDFALLLETAATVNKATTRTPGELVSKVIIVRPLPSHGASRDRSYEQDFRFALVREVAKSSKAVKVIWLTVPRNTCASLYDRSYYPIINELFYTDQCNCRPVPLSRIVGVHDAAVYPDASGTTNSIIIQLLYREDDAAFVTPRKVDLLCTCQSMAIEDVDYQQCSASTEDGQEVLPVLRNMSLFSGCGLLDYGMKEGGSGLIETVLSIDHNENAIRAHAANSVSKNCTHIVGSVNVHLELFLRGEAPLPEIDCITAGCPCKGYSLLNAHRPKEKSQRNCSLLASVLSWIELFLPKLVLIENVPSMDCAPKEKSLANACAQAICCLVAMGYQVRKVFLAAYEHGSPTLRRRLFLIAAAPGVPLPETPMPTHGDEPDLEPIVTIGDVLKDLKPIHNDTVVNIEDPLHIPGQRLRPIIESRVSLRNAVHRIPKTYGSGLYQAHEKGLLSKDQKRWFYSLSDAQRGPNSKTLRRVDPHYPFKTMVTIISPLDCRFGGEIVHPYEDRLLSLKEIRRAQGIPDSFLLVGSLKNQIELVGNGVAWQVAAALGRSFGHSWSKYCESIEDLDDGQDNSRLTQRILQTPQKMSARFTEATKTLGARAPTRSSPAPERYSNSGSQLQRRLREMSLEEDTAGTLPEGDTVEVKTQSSESVSREPSPRIRARVGNTSPARKRKVTVSIPITSSRAVPKVEDNSPAPAGNGPARDRAASEEVHEISDHENLVITPNGTYNYQRSQRGKITRRSSSAKKTAKPVPVVIIPARTKRPASPTPPPPTMRQSKASEPTAKDESDSEVEYLETRPVTKKPRVTARIGDWYDDWVLIEGVDQ